MLADSVDVRAAGAKPVAKSRGSRFLRHLLIGLDAVALTVAWTIAVLTSTSGFTFAGLATVAACVAGSVVLFNGIGLYRSRVCTVRVLEFERLARACIGVVLLALAAGAVVGSPLSPGAMRSAGCSRSCSSRSRAVDTECGSPTDDASATSCDPCCSSAPAASPPKSQRF